MKVTAPNLETSHSEVPQGQRFPGWRKYTIHGKNTAQIGHGEEQNSGQVGEFRVGCHSTSRRPRRYIPESTPLK